MVVLACVSTLARGQNALPSWSDGLSKDAIIDFVEKTTKVSSPSFVPPAERIAVFDNDGTLWAEKPAYFQLYFAMDRVKAMADEHPEWKDVEPYKSALNDDLSALAALGEKGIAQLIAATHAGMTADEFSTAVRDWIDTARHPSTGRMYTDMVYQPMLEVLDFLRDHEFKTFIVSGGGIDFMRAFAEETYGIPPEQVVGSSIKVAFEMREGEPTLVKTPELEFIDDKEGKPIGIYNRIGRRPIMAFGNSDGDLQMLQYTTAGDGPRFGLLVHHTDSEREWAYDRYSHVGQLDLALDQAVENGWVVVDMARDWNIVFP